MRWRWARGISRSRASSLARYAQFVDEDSRKRTREVDELKARVRDEPVLFEHVKAAHLHVVVHDDRCHPTLPEALIFRDDGVARVAHVIEDAGLLKLGVNALEQVSLGYLFEHVRPVFGKLPRTREKPVVGVDDDEGVAENLVREISEALDVVATLEGAEDSLALQVEIHVELRECGKLFFQLLLAERRGEDDRALGRPMHDVGKSRAGVNERKAGIVLVGDRLAFGHEHKHLRNSLLKRCPREDDDVSVHVNVGSLNVRRRLERTQDRPQLHSNIFLSRSLRWQVEYGTLFR